MNKITKVFKAFYEIAKNPKLVNRILDDNAVWMQYVVKKHAQYRDGLPVVEITDLIPNFHETLDVVDFLGGGSTPPDLAIIKALCRSVPNCKYFEIGTWRGESVSNAAEVCSECYTLNLDPEKSFNGMYRDIFGFFSKNNPKVNHVYGDSRTFDYAGLNKKFDVVFIDADHHYEFIKNDTLKVWQNLVHENSIIIWHDLGLNPSVPRYETIAALLDAIPSEKHKHLYHVSNSLCAVYTTRTLPSHKLVNPANPNKRFKVTLEAIKL